MRIQSLEELLRLARIAKYGPGSEKLNSAQLELLEFEPGAAAPQTKRKQHPGRQTLPADLHAWNEWYPARPSNAHAGVAAANSGYWL